VLEWWRTEHDAAYRITRGIIEDIVRQRVWPDAIVMARLKKSEQIVRKLQSGRTRLSTIDDIAGCRLVVRTLAQSRSVVPVIDALVDVRTVKDMTETPSPLGYRAIHLLVLVEGRRAEVQVRTRRQHAWAEMVEAHDQVTHDDAKHGRAPEHVIAGLFAMSEILSTIDHQHPEEDQ
jgi:ppGpp synthetase/RelA/SpoT-type nucleotidyltranferase